MREMKEYRLHLTDILRYFGERQTLSNEEVGEYIGRAADTVRRMYGIKKDGISPQNLARLLSVE